MPEPGSDELRERALAMIRRGLTNREAARTLEVAESTVRYWRRAAGLPSGPRGRPPTTPRRVQRRRTEPRRGVSYYLSERVILAVLERSKRDGLPPSAIVERLLRGALGISDADADPPTAPPLGTVARRATARPSAGARSRQANTSRLTP